jgi:DNA polymerase-1
VDLATKIMDKYLGKMNKLKGFLDRARDTLAEKGYTESYYGRRRYIPKIYSSDKFEKWAAERESANHIIQGSNADIIRLAMIEIDNMIQSNNYKSKMILQVHDELVFDLHPDEIEILPNKVKAIMESVVTFDIIMRADAKVADNWAEAH